MKTKKHGPFDEELDCSTEQVDVGGFSGAFGEVSEGWRAFKERA